MSKQLAGLELLAQSSNVQQVEVTTPSSTWPDPLAEEAYYGLTGDIIRLMEPHTEADPAALLFSFFLMFGSVIGRSAHFIAEADKHYMNLFISLAGPTSKGRKGTSQGQILRLYESVDMDWTKHCIKQGLSSGEGLLWAVRDEQRETKTNKKGEQQEVIVVDGVEDKRLLVIESEFATSITQKLAMDLATASYGFVSEDQNASQKEANFITQILLT